MTRTWKKKEKKKMMFHAYEARRRSIRDWIHIRRVSIVFAFASCSDWTGVRTRFNWRSMRRSNWRSIIERTCVCTRLNWRSMRRSNWLSILDRTGVRYSIGSVFDACRLNFSGVRCVLLDRIGVRYSIESVFDAWLIVRCVSVELALDASLDLLDRTGVR